MLNKMRQVLDCPDVIEDDYEDNSPAETSSVATEAVTQESQVVSKPLDVEPSSITNHDRPAASTRQELILPVLKTSVMPTEPSKDVQERVSDLTFPPISSRPSQDSSTSDSLESLPVQKFIHLDETLLLPNVSTEDSLFYRVESLRIYLEEQVGVDSFRVSYNLLKELQQQDDDDDLNRRLAASLPGKKMRFLSLINQLIYCEERISNQIT